MNAGEKWGIVVGAVVAVAGLVIGFWPLLGIGGLVMLVSALSVVVRRSLAARRGGQHDAFRR